MNNTVIWIGFLVLFTGILALDATALDFDPNPDLVVYDHEDVHNFGLATAVCDLNNDQSPDLVVGTGQGNLTVYVYYGGPLDRIPDLTITPPTGYSPDSFGSKILCGGDFNDDGAVDLVVSDAPNARNRAYIYYGGESFDQEPDVNLTGYTSYNSFGNALSNGDLNNDGVDDLVVGASSNGVFVFYGSDSFDGTADLQFYETPSSYGLSVSAQEDLNDDGIDDLAVGSYPGDIFVYSGGASFDNSSDVTISGLESGSGYHVSTGGDLNGDTEADLVVSGGSNTYVFYGGHGFDGTLDLNISGVVAGSQSALLSSADLNNDGFNDLVVSVGGSSVRVYYGGTGLDNVSDVTISPGVEYFGRSLAEGDLNEDGVSDLVVGAATWLFGGEDSCKVYLYHGATSPLTREVHETWSKLNTAQPTIVTLQGKLTNASSGESVEAASFRVTISNSTGQLWVNTFDDALSDGVFNIPLGASNELNLVKQRLYTMVVEVDVGSTVFVTSDVAFGDNTPAGDVIKFRV